MGSRLLLGIDLGTTVLKASVFDARSGRLIAGSSRRLPVRTDAAGMREQETRDVDRALKTVVSELRSAVGRRWDSVAGIGLAAQGGSAIIADRASGDAHTRMQLWNDSRPLSFIPAIAAMKPPRYWQRLTRMNAPGAGLARIKWLRERHPDLFRAENIYIGAGEYLFHRLTGVWRQDVGNALQIGCYSVPGRCLVVEPLKLVGVPLSFVAPMRRGHETHPLAAGGRRLLGLGGDVPVAGPYIDQEAGYLAVAGTSKRPLQCSLGTAWVGNMVCGRKLPPGSGVRLVLPSPVDSGSLMIHAMPAGNVTWDWALATFAAPKFEAALKAADRVFAEGLLPHEGLVCLPWLTRPNPFDTGMAGGGCFLGINAHTTGADLLRAAATGLAFEFARMFEAGGFDSVTIGGGASKGWYFRTIFAALFDPVPVFLADDEDVAGTRGVVYAFSRKVATSSLRRVKKAPPGLVARLHAQYEYYRTVRRSVIGGLEPAGRAGLGET